MDLPSFEVQTRKKEINIFFVWCRVCKIMKSFMILAAVVAVASAQGARPVYGPPEKEFEQAAQPQGPSSQPGEAFQPTTYRHVYVHAAPDEPVDEQARTIRVPGGDKHVNIIFVKTPSQSSQSQTEVILPEQDEHKNLVYVLLKKNEAENNIRIRRPPTQRPQSPEVYFIRYKDQEQEQQQNGQGQGGYQQGPPPQNGNGNRGSSSFDVGPAPPRPPSPPPRQNGNGGGNGGYSEAGRYTPAVAPGIIRGPSDVPSSGYGVPL